MGRRVVEIEVVFLDVLTMVSFTVGETEEAFLQNGIFPVPQRHGEAELLLVVADARQSVFAPAIRAGTSLIVREVVPGIAVAAVVLANRAPLPFAQVWSPLFPG